MSTGDEFVTSRKLSVRLAGILNNLRTWWLLLTVSGFVLALLLVYASHRGSSDVKQLALILAAAIFLCGMILSTVNTERNAQDRDDPFTWLARLRCMMAMGIAVVVGFAAAHSGKNEDPVTIAGVGVLTAGAAWTAGILLGFIFGLPRPKGNTRPQSREIPTEDGQTSVDAQVATNLEQIADWLTKLIVGAGLTQITTLPQSMNKLASRIGTGMGEGEAFKSLALAICAFFFSSGFLFGYLWGRLFMPDAFRAFDRRNLNRDRNTLGL